jgi:hypothetical protein
MGNEKTEDQTKTEIIAKGKSSKGRGVGHRGKRDKGQNTV